MQGFATSPNPFFTGIRPRGFFTKRAALLKSHKLSGSHDAEKKDTIQKVTIKAA